MKVYKTIHLTNNWRVRFSFEGDFYAIELFSYWDGDNWSGIYFSLPNCPFMKYSYNIKEELSEVASSLQLRISDLLGLHTARRTVVDKKRKRNHK